MDYYDNLTYGSTEMGKDPFPIYNENDDFIYDAELVPFNQTHDCIRLFEKVGIYLDLYKIEVFTKSHIYPISIYYILILISIALLIQTFLNIDPNIYTS